ncbi:hypothetical protein HYT45_01090 [Candidatus Uhrbacteria bacterium]|nr:hypothetical protein [Candidatus Uhrbacteria bacterium]
MNKLLGAGDIIEGSWLLYKTNRKPLMRVALWMFAPTVVVTSVNLLLRLLSVGEIAAIITSLLVSIPSYLIRFWAAIILVLALDAAIQKQEFDVKKLGEDAARKFLPVLIVSILAGLAMLGGFLLFVIPGIIFSIWFAFAYYEAILHGAKGADALKKSRRLSRGRFWAALWRLAAPAAFWSVVVWLATSAIFQLFSAATIPWKEIISTGPGSAYLSAILDAISNLIQSLSAPLLTAVGVLLYRALKESGTETTATAAQ